MHFSARDPFDRTALHLAVFSGDVSSAQFLFESVPDEAGKAALLNALDCDGRTPLMYSVFYPESLACLGKIYQFYFVIIERILELRKRKINVH